jgi:Ricin-type beta-trefoil lectin domain/PAN domain
MRRRGKIDRKTVEARSHKTLTSSAPKAAGAMMLRLILRPIARSVVVLGLVFVCTPTFALQLDGAIKLANGKCLDADSAGWMANGGRVQVWDCNQQPNQTWHYNSTIGAIKSDGGLCLDADSRQYTADGGIVQVYTCNNWPNQHWTVSQGLNAVIISSGLCLDADAAQMSNNGGPVQVWACNNQPQQAWTFAPLAPTAAQLAALINPWPLVPGVYEFKVKNSNLCIGRWDSGNETIQQVPCNDPRAKLAVAPSYTPEQVTGPGLSFLYIVRPVYIRPGEARAFGDLSMCATQGGGFLGVGVQPIYGSTCSTNMCASDAPNWIFGDASNGLLGGFGQIYIRTPALYFTTSAKPDPTSTPPMSMWSVQAASTNVNAAVIMWDHDPATPPPESIFTPTLVRPYTLGEFQPQTSCVNPPPAITNLGSWVGTTQMKFAPAVTNVDLPGSEVVLLSTPNAVTCAERCAENASCVAYSWSSGKQLCSLKSNVPSAAFCATCTSGVLFP